MRRTTAAAMTLALAGAAVTGPAHAAAPSPAGCKDFGQNVAFLGTNLGPVFGQIASGVATSGPGEFRDNVVKREQADLCF